MSTPTSAASSSLTSSVSTQPPSSYLLEYAHSILNRRWSKSQSHSQPQSQDNSRTNSRATTPAGAQAHTNEVHSRPGPQPRASAAILGGTERFLALFDEERLKLEARHKQQLIDLEERFEKFRVVAEEEHSFLRAQVRDLEAKVGVAKGKEKEEREGRDVDTDIGAGAATSMLGTSSAESSSANPAEGVDDATVSLLRQFAAYKNNIIASARDPSSNPNPDLSPGTIPDPFISALAQYLKAHNKTLQEAQMKVHVAEAERDAIQRVHDALLADLQAKHDTDGTTREKLENRMKNIVEEEEESSPEPVFKAVLEPQEETKMPQESASAAAEPVVACIAPDTLNLKRGVEDVAGSSSVAGPTKRPKLSSTHDGTIAATIATGS